MRQPTRLSPRAKAALALLATGLRRREAAAEAGLSQRQFQRVLYSPIGRAFLDEQQARFLDELRHARIVRQLERDARVLTAKRR